jgi:putative (di)nucleoside polyphosphate hydrolase
MIQSSQYRPNVGIIIANQKNQVFLAKRVNQNAWQFPQGGIKLGESVEEAMYRELLEETGLMAHHIQILGCTGHWLQYDVPLGFIKSKDRHIYRGQKQIWFLVRLLVSDKKIMLDIHDCPEFDNWCWCDYWLPIERIVDFKKAVYQTALQELSIYLTGLASYRDWKNFRSKN